MRINVYSQELTDEVQIERRKSDTGSIYFAVRIMLHSSSHLHQQPMNDDRSGVTFWLPRSPQRREALARTFEKMAAEVRAAPAEEQLCIVCKEKPRWPGSSLCAFCEGG